MVRSKFTREVLVFGFRTSGREVDRRPVQKLVAAAPRRSIVTSRHGGMYQAMVEESIHGLCMDKLENY
jgi:hypothetical protein